MKKYMQGLLALLMLFGMNLEAARDRMYANDAKHTAKKAEEPRRMVVKKKEDKKQHKVKYHAKKVKVKKADQKRTDKDKKQEKTVKHVKKAVDKEKHKTLAHSHRDLAEHDLKEAAKNKDIVQDLTNKKREEHKRFKEVCRSDWKSEASKKRHTRALEEKYKKRRTLLTAREEDKQEANRLEEEIHEHLCMASREEAQLEHLREDVREKERKAQSKARDHKAKMKEHAQKAGMKNALVVQHPDDSAEKKAEEKMKKAQDKARHEKRVARARAQQKADDAKHKKASGHGYDRSDSRPFAQDNKKVTGSKRAGRMSQKK